MISEPSRPEGPLVISNIEANSVYLAWKPPLEDNGGPILGYVIEAKDVLHMDVRKTYVWSEGTKTECLVQDLETGHIYQFRVYAQNEAGRGEGLLNKSLVRIKAKSKKPPKPSKPTAEVLGEDSVLLQWTVPKDCGNVNFLVERYEPKNDLWFQCNREMVIATSYLVTGLSLDREYLFRVSSENAHGFSLPSEASEPVKWSCDEGEAPLVIVPLKDCFVKSSEAAFFKCEYTGTRPIQVNWTKDDIRIREGLGSVITNDDSGISEMTLNEVDSDDDDCSVQCSLQNVFGRTTSEAAIRILSMPQLGYPSSYKELTFDCGDALRLRVTFSGKPSPVTKWFFNGKEPSLNDRISMTRHPDFVEIRIQDLTAEDSGVYRFVASNVMGEDSLDVRVIITGPPDPPKGDLIFKIEDDEVFLVWNPPLYDGGSEIFNYIAEKKFPGGEIWSKCGTTHKTSLNLGDPDEVEGYIFRVKATNIYGTSEPSEETQFQRSCLDESLDKPFSEIQSSEQQKDLNLMQFEDDESPDMKFESGKQKDFAIETKFESLLDLETDMFQFEEDNLIELSSEASLINVKNISSPLFSCFCSTYTELLPEAPYFASERSLTVHCLVPELRCNFFHKICFSNVVFETVNNLPESEFFVTSCFYSWIFHENFLEVSKPLCFWAISQQTQPVDILDCFLQNKCHSETETRDTFWYFAVQNDEKHSTSLQEFSISCEFHQPSCSVRIFCPPLVFENLETLELQKLMKDQCNSSFICYKSIQIFVNKSLEMFPYSDTYNLLDFSRKATIRCQSFEDFGDIISLSSTPIRTWKPALSVLPIMRKAETEYPSKESFSNTINVKPLDNNAMKILLEGFSENRKTEIETCSSSEKYLPTKGIEQVYNLNNKFANRSEADESNKSDTKILNYGNSVLKFTQEIQPSVKLSDDLMSLKSMPKGKEDSKMSGISTVFHENIPTTKYTIPFWLMNVSPYTFPNIETNLLEMRMESADETQSSEVKPTTGDSSKLNLKEKSVEELLKLAEEVERSFNEKAEQFESLESILHNELSSLKKDLEAVNDIHRNLDDPFGYLDSYICDDLAEHLVVEDPKPVEENLIEFSDAPSSNSQGSTDIYGYPPEVVVHLQNRVIQSGCRTRLYCSIMGDPDPEITWMKNRKPMHESSRYMFGNLVEFGVYMDIFNAKSSDSGEYSCVATNCYGSAQTQSYLQVIGSREVSPEEPKFLKSPEDISCRTGESIVMEWKITGAPTPHVIWFKNAERIETSLRIDTFSNHRGCCRLVIRDVNTNDNAIYTCYLENEAGSAISTVLLSVEDLGNTLNFQEHRENQPLVDEEIVTPEILSHSPPVEESDDGSTIWRRAYSRDKQYRRNECEDPIGPIVAPHVLSSGQTWTILTWSPPLEGKCRYEYLIERRLLNSDHWTEVGRTFNTLFTVHGLKKGRSYIYRVSAGNSRGWSLPTTVSQPVHAPPR